jgi:hypothetical protein
MPLRDNRTKAGISNGKHRTAGRLNVSYRDTSGSFMDALVVGQGTSSGLKISIRNGGTVRILDNVAKATTIKSTNAYHERENLGV